MDEKPKRPPLLDCAIMGLIGAFFGMNVHSSMFVNIVPKGLVAGALLGAPLISVAVGLAAARLGGSGRLGGVISVVASGMLCGAGFYALAFFALP